MRRPLLTALLLATVLAAGGDAHAQTTAPLPLGTDGHGVRLVKRGHPAHLVVLLSPKRYRAVAGHELLMACAPVPQVTLGGETTVRRGDSFTARPPGGVVVRLHPPQRRAPLVTHLSPTWDWCAMEVLRRSDHGRSTSERGFATVPLTPAGAAFADERQVAVRVIVSELLLFEFGPRERRFWTRRLIRAWHAVVLSSPAEQPPPGRFGIYLDGSRHFYAAQTDRAGDLLFYEQDGDVTRTNLLRFLQDDSLLFGA